MDRLLHGRRSRGRGPRRRTGLVGQGPGITRPDRPPASVPTLAGEGRQPASRAHGDLRVLRFEQHGGHEYGPQGERRHAAQHNGPSVDPIRIVPGHRERRMFDPGHHWLRAQGGPGTRRASTGHRFHDALHCRGSRLVPKLDLCARLPQPSGERPHEVLVAIREQDHGRHDLALHGAAHCCASRRGTMLAQGDVDPSNSGLLWECRKNEGDHGDFACGRISQTNRTEM